MKLNLRTIGKSLLPAPFDAWIVITILIWTIAAFSSILWQFVATYDPVMTPLPVMVGASSIIVAIGLMVCVGHRSRTLWVLFSITISFAFLLLFLLGPWLSSTMPRSLDDYYDQGESTSASQYILVYRWYPIMLCVFAAVSFQVTKLLHRYSVTLDWIPRALTCINKHRARIMLAFIAVMLPTMVIRNVVDPHYQSAPILTTITVICFFVLWGLLTVVFLGRFVLNRKWVGIKVVISFGALFGWCIYAIRQIRSNNHSDGLDTLAVDAAIGIAPVGFLLTAMAFVMHALAKSSERRISIWSLPLLLGAISLPSWAIYRYDPLPIVSELIVRPENCLKWWLLETAKQSQDLRRQTNGAARILSAWGQPRVTVQIRGPQDANCINQLAKHYQLASPPIVIENIEPFVDTSRLSTFSTQVSFRGGQITANQLTDVNKAVAHLRIDRSKLPTKNATQTSPPTICISSDECPSQLSEFLDAFVPTGLSKVTLYCPLDDEAWQAAIRHNAACKFTIPVDDLHSAQIREVLSKDVALGGVTLLCWNVTLTPKTLKLLVQSDVLLDDFWGEEQAYWDLVFAKPHLEFVNRWFGSDVPFADQAKAFHWAYGWNDKDQVTDIWLPDASIVSDNVGQLSSVKTLRLDREGIVGISDTFESDLSPLSRLLNLEHLYLGREHYLKGLQFLGSLKNLKLLRIQSQARQTVMGSGFELCANLESIRFFGTPDPQSINELATLTKLKTIEIVNDDSDFTTQAEVAALENQLPNIKILITAPDDYQLELSAKLKAHLQNRRDEIIARLDKQIEAENE